MRIEATIGRLVLDGFDRRQAAAVRAVLEAGLGEHLAARATASSQDRRNGRAGSAAVVNGLGAEHGLAAAIRRAVTVPLGGSR